MIRSIQYVPKFEYACTVKHIFFSYLTPSCAEQGISLDANQRYCLVIEMNLQANAFGRHFER